MKSKSPLRTLLTKPQADLCYRLVSVFVLFPFHCDCQTQDCTKQRPLTFAYHIQLARKMD